MVTGPFHQQVGAATRPAVEEQGGLSLRVAAFLVVDLVRLRHLQHACPIGRDVGVELEPLHG